MNLSLIYTCVAKNRAQSPSLVAQPFIYRISQVVVTVWRSRCADAGGSLAPATNRTHSSGVECSLRELPKNVREVRGSSPRESLFDSVFGSRPAYDVRGKRQGRGAWKWSHSFRAADLHRSTRRPTCLPRTHVLASVLYPYRTMVGQVHAVNSGLHTRGWSLRALSSTLACTRFCCDCYPFRSRISGSKRRTL
jgi:hypothetical protein